MVEFPWRFQISDLYNFDMNYLHKGVKNLCGIDEAGRGPLAGPVYAAAYIFSGIVIKGVNDSKKLTPKRRQEIFKLINESGCIYSFGIATVDEIEELNILNATHLAMKRSVESLTRVPDLIIIDGNSSPDFGIKKENIVKGDTKSYSIACASIIAKVLRDNFISEMGIKFPEYGFSKNKGYGTKAHIEAIKKFGVCELHRKSFLGRIL